jgi:hypothetical protein
MHNCSCKPQCETFRQHVGTGPYISGAATPTQHGEVRKNLDTEKRWHKENDAYTRLWKQGYSLPHLHGADHIERHATTEIELKQGKILGEKKAKLTEKALAGEFS